MFGGSIADNIAYGCGLREQAPSLEEITRAADTANALGFISALPDGLETLVGERGVRPSLAASWAKGWLAGFLPGQVLV